MKFPFLIFGAADAAAAEAIPPRMSVEMISSGIRLAPFGLASPPDKQPRSAILRSQKASPRQRRRTKTNNFLGGIETVNLTYGRRAVLNAVKGSLHRRRHLTTYAPTRRYLRVDLQQVGDEGTKLRPGILFARSGWLPSEEHGIELDSRT